MAETYEENFEQFMKIAKNQDETTETRQIYLSKAKVLGQSQTGSIRSLNDLIISEVQSNINMARENKELLKRLDAITTPKDTVDSSMDGPKPNEPGEKDTAAIQEAQRRQAQAEDQAAKARQDAEQIRQQADAEAKKAQKELKEAKDALAQAESRADRANKDMKTAQQSQAQSEQKLAETADK